MNRSAGSACSKVRVLARIAVSVSMARTLIGLASSHARALSSGESTVSIRPFWAASTVSQTVIAEMPNSAFFSWKADATSAGNRLGARLNQIQMWVSRRISAEPPKAHQMGPGCLP